MCACLQGTRRKCMRRACRRWGLWSREAPRVFASNQVIGEAYVAVQLHYGVNKADAQAGLLEILEGDLVTPLNGYSVLALLRTIGGAGLFDRLIADGYAKDALTTLTLDRQMAVASLVRNCL